jgi:hypothetical protein
MLAHDRFLALAAQKHSRARVDHLERPPGELGQAGPAWITSISAPMFPAFKPLPKVFLKPVGYLSFSSAADLDHDVPWG